MWRVYIHQHPTLGPWYASVNRRPGWVTRTAVLAAVLVVVVPLLLLALAAVFVGLFVFVTLGLVGQVVAVVSDGWARATSGTQALWGRQGRRNVRVVRRRD